MAQLLCSAYRHKLDLLQHVTRFDTAVQKGLAVTSSDAWGDVDCRKQASGGMLGWLQISRHQSDHGHGSCVS